jgi:hypothetical protein
MPKTKKDVLLALADKIGGERAERIRASFETPLLKGLKAWNEILSEEEFESQLKKTEIGLKKAALLNRPECPGDPASWGLN